MKLLKQYLFVAGLVIVFAMTGFAQTTTDSLKQLKSVEDKPLKFYLSDDKSRYFQVTFLNQLWVRQTDLNPGSTVFGERENETFDIGLRRTRFQMYGQVTERAFIYFQIGMNNFNRMTNVGANRKVGLFIHDAVCEYRVSSGNQLKIGGGLTIANGLSRFSQPSIGTILALDVPVFAQATVDQTDLFSRKLSVYARGQIGKWDYRFSLSDPFPITSAGLTTIPALNTTNATFAQKGHSLQYQTYQMIQLFDKEDHSTPYMKGSYLGKKKIVNLGAGLIYQPKATWIQDAVKKDTTYQDMLLWSAELFVDLPINKEKETAITGYVGYFNMDYGTNYLRKSQQMNPADPNVVAGSQTSNSISGGGNGFPMVGTGNIVYAQLGYLFKKDLLGNQGTLQPYVTSQFGNFNAIGSSANIYDVGVNWLIKGHKQKISFDIQNRPVFDTQNHEYTRKNSFILQYQIFI